MDNKNVIAIISKDGKSYLTEYSNLNCILEFVKKTNAKIFKVKDSNVKTMNLKEMARAFCNQNYKCNQQFELSDRLYPSSSRKRTEMIKFAKNIRDFIRKEFEIGNQISLKEMKEMFKSYNLTDACICSHIAKVRNKMIEEGYNFVKTGTGKYALK